LKQRYANIEQKQQEAAQNDSFDRVIAMMTSFAQADPTKGFGFAAAKAADASQALKKDQRALHEAQEMKMAEIQGSLATADDARKRGDVAAAEKASADARDAKLKLNDLVLKEQQVQVAMAQTGLQGISSITNMMSEGPKLALESEKLKIERARALKAPDNVAYAQAYALSAHVPFDVAVDRLIENKNQNTLISAYESEWKANGIDLETGKQLQSRYKSFDEFLKSKGIRSPQSGPAEGETRTDKKGNRIMFVNGQWVYP